MSLALSKNNPENWLGKLPLLEGKHEASCTLKSAKQNISQTSTMKTTDARMTANAIKTPIQPMSKNTKHKCLPVDWMERLPLIEGKPKLQPVQWPNNISCPESAQLEKTDTFNTQSLSQAGLDQSPAAFPSHYETIKMPIPTRITHRQQLFSKTASTTPHINTLYSDRRRSHEPTNCIKVSTDIKTNKQTIPSLFLINACHILNKMDELSSVAEINGPDLICISETWLDPSINNGVISIGPNYTPYRKDRGTPGGGLITDVKTAIPSIRLFDMEEEGKEALWLLLKPQRLLRPFSQAAINEITMIDYLINGIDFILQSYHSAGIIIAGDFNKMKFGTLFNCFDLRKIVKKPTCQNNTLDQIMTNMSPLFQEVQHLPPLGRSDHQCLLLNPKHRTSTPPITKTFRSMKRSNLIALEPRLSRTVWDAVYEAEDVDDKVSIFNGLTSQALDECMPLKSIRLHPTDKPWMTPNIKAKIKLRQRAFTRGNMTQYNLLSAQVEDMIRKAKSNYYQNKAKTFRTSDPAKWYKAIYNLSEVSSQHEGLTVNCMGSEAALAEQFQISFTEPWKDLIRTSIPQLDEADVLAPIVHDIITASIKQCKYPSHYKHGLVTPVPKAYPPTDVSNDFRQISVLPHIGKILERVQLQLNQNDIILRPSQHGFTSGRSTKSALISITQPWFNATHNTCRDKAGIHALFIDFKKAFDLVDHGILLNKLALMNVNKSFWLWVKCFLSGRTQQVKINKTLSSIEGCPAGVPQGSALSPTLFNIHNDDLDTSAP
ncbi:Hypothetical predicted protein [Paramuricea clavata]|uniref:Uncharacterized protein n=1 Tax=Paramuricea clavata TaxID=317549 RepID=A0A6S7FKM6_PARCT|nr:Hypothetical predicted protein [Paramuricea clavata]